MSQPEICMVYFNVSGMWHSRDVAAHFADMKSMGVDSIFTNWRELSGLGALKFKVDLAHEAGLRVYASPGRVAGLFAAGPRPGSMFATRNPETLMRYENGEPVVGTGGFVCCVNQPGFQKWFYPYMQEMIDKSGADGIIFDEPKETVSPCWCDVCKSRVDEQNAESLANLRTDGMAAMMGKTCALVKELDSSFTTSAMLMPVSTDRFIEKLSQEKALDAFGVDGPLCAQGEEGLDRSKLKTPLFDSAPKFLEMAHKAGKRSFVLTETFDVHKWAHEELRRNVVNLPELGADIYAFNYYGHENEDPEGLMEILREGIAGLKA